MLVSGGSLEACQSLIGDVGLRWVPDKACQSPKKQVEVSDGFPIQYVGLRWVSNNNNIFVNSFIINLSFYGKYLAQI